MPSNTRRGLTLVEAIISLLVIALMAAAGLGAAGQAARTRRITEDRARGQALAATLLAEIMSKPYREIGSTSLGLDAGESGASRATFDDADDYKGYTQSPPTTSDATPLASPAWAWSVSLEWVGSSDIRGVPGELGQKLITVTVTRDGRTVGSAFGIRSRFLEEAFQ